MRLSYHARAFIVECPVRDQILHRHRIVACPQTVFLIQLMGLHDLIHIQLNPQPRRRRHLHHATFDLKRLLSKTLITFLPYPVGVDSSDRARRSGGDVREHRQRDIEVVVGVRTSGQAKLMAHLRHANRPLHRPEVRVSQRNID